MPKEGIFLSFIPGLRAAGVVTTLARSPHTRRVQKITREKSEEFPTKIPPPTPTKVGVTVSSAPPRDFASAKGFATFAIRAPVRWTESSLIMPVVTSDEKLAAETRLRSSATKQRITQPAILTAVALQRIIDGVYKTWKEAGDDLGLSAR